MATHGSSMTTIQSPRSPEPGTFLSASGSDHAESVPRKATKISSRESSPRPIQETGSRVEHTIQLSSIDHCMPRAYIRVCLAFRLPHPDASHDALAGLGRFLRKVVKSAPFLAGYVDPAPKVDGAIGRVQIHFSEEDVRAFPAIQTRRLTSDEMHWNYDQLDQASLPPSTIRPELISALPENTDDGRAPVFRVQANLVEGGLIVSIYLHHCVTDGFGLGLLVSGTIVDDAPEVGYANGMNGSGGVNGVNDLPGSGVNDLAAIATIETKERRKLSSGDGHDSERQLRSLVTTQKNARSKPATQLGRGCVFTIPQVKLNALKELLLTFLPNGTNDSKPFITDHDVLQALLWRRLSHARKPSLVVTSLAPTSEFAMSNLLIPVNIRSRMEPPLPSSYFGSAVDFASVRLPLHELSSISHLSIAKTALAIRHAVEAVQDSYVRSAISLSNTANIDVRDLLASNMNRTTGADMYITSWLNLPLYERGDLGMGLGKPDWVRKPWSRDPGACIILPQDPRKDVVEVVVQLAIADMERLLEDDVFMDFVEKVIE